MVKKLHCAAIAAVFVCLGSALAAESSSAESSGRDVLSTQFLGPVPFGFESWRDLFAEQELLNAAAYRIMADPHAGERLAGVVASPAARRLQVYWKGELPESTRELLAQLRAGMPVDVQPARFSRRELLAAGERALELDAVVRVSPRSNGSGLDVGFDAARVDAHNRAAALARVMDALPGLRIDAASTPAEAFAHSRDSMAFPAYTGGRIASKSKGAPCSLGPPISRSVDGIRQYGWLTAAHCTETKTGDQIANGSTVLGKVVERVPGIDTSVIIAGAREKVSSRLYIGRPAGESASVPISYSRAPITGNIVYQTGSATGLAGPLLVGEPMWRWERKPGTNCAGGSSTTAGTSCEEDPGQKITDLFKATHLDGLAAVAPGDSGGAVFSFHTDGTAIVRGLNSGYEPPTVTCPADHRVPPGFRCTSGMSFVDIGVIQRVFAVTVVTERWPN